MLHRSITPLLIIAALLLVIVGPSISRPLSRRVTASTSTLNRHRFVRRSPSSLQQRSIDKPVENGRLLPLGGLPDDVSNNSRRSLDNDLDEEKAYADKDWEEFAASTPDEDLDSYSDSFDDEESVPSCSGANEHGAFHNASKTSPSSATSIDSGKVNSSVNLSGAENKTPHPNDSEAAKKNVAQAENKKDTQDEEATKQQHAEADKQKKAKADKQKKAEADKQKKAEADKQKKAEADKQKKAEADKQKKAEADKQKKAEADKQKKAEEEKHKEAEADKLKKAEEEKQKEAQAAKAKNDAEQANAAKGVEGTKEKQAGLPTKSSDSYQITDVKPIPGTPVTTGTAHKDHSADSYSSPPADMHTGDATYYEPDLGACGLTNHSSDMIVAVSHLLYDSFPSQGGNPNTNTVCGKRIRATYQGRSVEVTVVDRCEGCDHDSLDFTITAFEKLGSKDEGRLHGMTWTFI